MGFSAFGFLFNMLTVLLLYLDLIFYARLSFAFCCLCMIFSIFFIFTRNKTFKRSFKISFKRYGLDEKRFINYFLS